VHRSIQGCPFSKQQEVAAVLKRLLEAPYLLEECIQC
jgi:hypothetical protein